MKAIARLSIFLLCLLLASCGSRKRAVNSATVAPDEKPVVVTPTQEGNQPAEAKQREETCITSRLRLELVSGGRSASVGGTLRMKHADVIQLSLTTFGILEVARIEMTPDYFMLIDKIGKQYVKAAYGDVSFLREGRVDFNTIQSFFWNEQTAYVPGWERKDFVNITGTSLPTKHLITIPVGNRNVKADLTLSALNTDSEWEKRTPVPSRYKEVSVEEAMTRIMNLTK